jgi:hypothetical protein
VLEKTDIEVNIENQEGNQSQYVIIGVALIALITFGFVFIRHNKKK